MLEQFSLKIGIKWHGHKKGIILCVPIIWFINKINFCSSNQMPLLNQLFPPPVFLDLFINFLAL